MGATESARLYLRFHDGNALSGMAVLLELHAVTTLVEEHMASSLANSQRRKTLGPFLYRPVCLNTTSRPAFLLSMILLESAAEHELASTAPNIILSLAMLVVPAASPSPPGRHRIYPMVFKRTTTSVPWPIRVLVNTGTIGKDNSSHISQGLRLPCASDTLMHCKDLACGQAGTGSIR
jgi:hypothetical protein